MEPLKEITHWGTNIFKRYQDPHYNYKIFEVRSDLMDGGTINDTPKGAFILGKKICDECTIEFLTKSCYGFIVKHRGEFMQCDLHLTLEGCLGYSFRSRNDKDDDPVIKLFENEDEIEEIYEVIVRSY